MTKPGPKPILGSKASMQLNIAFSPEFMGFLQQQATAAGFVGKGSAVEYARELIIAGLIAHKAPGTKFSLPGAAIPPGGNHEP